jgi:hypothetical protein
MNDERRDGLQGFGSEVRVTLDDCEVSLTLIAEDPKRAHAAYEALVQQLKSGALRLTLIGTPNSHTERRMQH